MAYCRRGLADLRLHRLQRGKDVRKGVRSEADKERRGLTREDEEDGTAEEGNGREKEGRREEKR